MLDHPDYISDGPSKREKSAHRTNAVNKKWNVIVTSLPLNGCSYPYKLMNGITDIGNWLFSKTRSVATNIIIL